MKKNLKTLIKTRSPLKGKISDLIESKMTPKSGISVIPLAAEAPSTDVEIPKKKDHVSLSENLKDKTKYESSPVKYMEELKQAIQNSVTNNKVYTNNINNNKTVVNKNISSKKYDNVENVFNKAIKNIRSFTDQNVVKNISSTNPKNIHRRDERNYITSSFNLPFIQNDHTTNDNASKVINKVSNDTDVSKLINNVTNDNVSRVNNLTRNESNFNISKGNKPALIEKTNNFYNPIQSSAPVKLKTPTITKFPDVLNTKTTNFSKENKYFTDRVNNMLSNSASMKIFTTKGNVVKSTKEILNHVKDRQNNIVPMLQSGGLVNSPTLAMLGEAGPEMVTPMKQDTQGMMPSLESSPSITSSANKTMLERAAYQVNETNPRGKEKPEQSISLDPNSFSRPINKQTAPEGSGAGGDAGSSAFSSFYRARMFSLPDWRSRLA